MLINLTFENWTSFKEVNEMDCHASYELRHKDRCAYVKKFKESFLPVVMVIGGNAAGKSNLLSIFSFLRSLVLNPLDNEKGIPVQPYLFQSIEGDSAFKIDMLINELIYSLEIRLNRAEIIFERLSLINSTSKHVFYERRDGKIFLGNKFQKNQNLKSIALGTRKNRLFLTNTVDQQDDSFIAVYNWFKGLDIINPDQISWLPENVADEIEEISRKFMPKLDTGIKRIEFKETPEAKVALPDQLMKEIKGSLLEENSTAFVQNANGTEQVLVYYEDGVHRFKKAMAIHESSSGEYVLDLKYESEGTRRVIHLLPKFYALMNENKGVLIIDELDRSLHTQLTRSLIESYMDSCNEEKRTQLIFSTHDMMLLDQDLFRRDEMWLAERNRNNESELFSIADFEEVRSDTDIRKLYLNGRFGGNPKISNIF